MDKQEKLDLYNKAKDAYYNSGTPIMSDLEFDQLEKDLGLENKSYIGSQHAKYTVKHSFKMGSLSKVQVLEDKNHEVQWNEFYDKINSYLKKSKKPEDSIQVTLKFDGTSWSLELYPNGNFNVATRGDGDYGKDLTQIFKVYRESHQDEWKDLDHVASKLNKDEVLVVRGECLIDKNLFLEKYAQDFTNPRSFVSGIVNQDYDPSNKIQQEQIKDIQLVAYDYRLYNGTTKSYKELNYFSGEEDVLLKEMSIGKCPELQIQASKNSILNHFEEFYNRMVQEREKCQFMIDGFVIKPLPQNRQDIKDRTRPEDCVAIKFLPEIAETEIVDIEWKLGKTREFFPTAIFKEITIGDKKVTRASLHNYGYLIDNKVSIGSKIKISLAGDIIPFVYEVLSEGTGDLGLNDVLKVNEGEVVNENGSAHLMVKSLSEEDEARIKFGASIIALQLNGIGDKTANKLFDLFAKNGFIFNNICFLMNDNCCNTILNSFGDSKSTRNIIESLKKKRETISLEEIIQSCSFELCGEKVAIQCAKILRGENPDLSGLAKVGYSWAFNKSSEKSKFILSFVKYLNREDLLNKKEEKQNNSSKIKIIMTGSPKEFGYKTKGEFLDKHPEYEEISKWDECQILFTDDLSSESSKMKKAKKLKIEIKTYD